MDTAIPRGTTLFLQAGKRDMLILSVVYLFCLLLIGFIMMASNALEIPLEHFTADPAGIYNAHPFIGIASNIMILMWCATAAICLFTFFLPAKRSRESYFILGAGLLTTVLLFDDLFMLHEAVYPWYLGIQEEATYAAYATLVVFFLVYFRHEIFKTDYIFLVAALGFFGSSVIADLILPQYGVTHLIENSLKLFGLSTWLFYFARVCFRRARRS